MSPPGPPGGRPPKGIMPPCGGIGPSNPGLPGPSNPGLFPSNPGLGPSNPPGLSNPGLGGPSNPCLGGKPCGGAMGGPSNIFGGG